MMCCNGQISLKMHCATDALEKKIRIRKLCHSQREHVHREMTKKPHGTIRIPRKKNVRKIPRQFYVGMDVDSFNEDFPIIEWDSEDDLPDVFKQSSMSGAPVDASSTVTIDQLRYNKRARSNDTKANNAHSENIWNRIEKQANSPAMTSIHRSGAVQSDLCELGVEMEILDYFQDTLVLGS
jgi:hypothetical protein